MEYAFYISGAIAVLATLRVVTNDNPVHALLYLTISLLAVAAIYFTLGAPFAGVLEIIVYAGAIMVLFVFVVMMLNLGNRTILQEHQLINPRVWIGPSVLALLLFIQLCYVLFIGEQQPAGQVTVDTKQVGIALYGPYLLAVELASMLLLAAMVAAYHLGRQDEPEA